MAKFRLSTATRLHSELKLLARIVNLNSFLNTFSVSDFRSIIERSSGVNSIILLYKGFLNYKIKESIKSRLGEALLSLSDGDLTRLVLNDHSTYRLTRLITNIQYPSSIVHSIEPDGRSTTASFIERLSYLDLEQLFTQEDEPARRRGYSKADTLSYFLSIIATLAPEGARKRIVSSISDEFWLTSMSSCSLRERFWILWNIYRCDPNRARLLVHRRKTGSLVLRRRNPAADTSKRQAEKSEESSKSDAVYYLPTLGLLYECGINVSRIPLQEEDVLGSEDLIKRAREWGVTEKPSPTLLVLSLIATKIRTPSKYEEHLLGSFLDKEPIHTYVYQNPQVGEILRGLIKKHDLEQGKAS